MPKQAKVAIFAVDPGGSTGVAMGIFRPADSLYKTLTKTNPSKASFTQVGDPLPQARQIFRAWRGFLATSIVTHGVPEGNVWMLIEDFVLSPNAAPGKDILLATKIAHTLMGYRYGAADEFDRLLANPIFPIQVAWQSASEAKSYATDERLRRWGLWVKGREHERDAFRHLAYFLNGEIR